MPAHSEKQAKLMKSVMDIQNCQDLSASDKVRGMAKSMTKKDVEAILANLARRRNSPSFSAKQEKLMKSVLSVQNCRDILAKSSARARLLAKNMGRRDVKDLATTENLKKLKEYIRSIVREMNTTANVQGYLTPKAFTKPGMEKKTAKKQADLTGYSVVTENRWLELKKEESPAYAKIGRGISNINKQLNEIERFLNWYARLKNESGTTNQQYWNRTHKNIYKIKERLIKLEQQIRKISE